MESDPELCYVAQANGLRKSFFTNRRRRPGITN